MQTKEIKEKFTNLSAGIMKLEQRVYELEQNGKIKITRPLTKKEEDNWPPQLTHQPNSHIDIYFLKDILNILLNHLELELIKVPEETKLKLRRK